MTQHEVARTLVKSAPELWEVCSDPDSLSRHLEAFGEIRITRVEPESTVAWEGERASGTVRIEPSGWGTRVILTATPVAGVAEPEPEDEVAGLPEAQPTEPAEPAPAVATGAAPAVVTEPAPAVAAEAAPAVVADPASAETAAEEPETPPARPGFFRRLGGILFRSLVTPVEIPDAAFAVPPAGEPEARPPEPEAGPPEPASVGVEPEPAPVEPAPAPVQPAPVAQLDTGEVLQTMLTRLGSDHHRPYSRT